MSSRREDENREARGLMLVIGGLLVALVVVAVALVTLIGLGGGGDEETGAPTTTTAPVGSTTTLPDDPTATAVWPLGASTTRYDDPVSAARGFSVDFVGFADPVLGEFRAGDARSGEVEVRPAADGPVTTVLVRQVGPDNSWWVLGSFTASIELGDPGVLDVVRSPLRVTGRARAFEGTVQLAIREDGNATPLTTGFVTGNGGEDLGPFEGTFPFSTPTQRHGSLVLTTESARDGSILEAAVLRISFAQG